MATLPFTPVAVDLSRLPAPQVVELLNFETIKADIVAEFQNRYEAFDALVESDPAMKLIEVFAYRELLLRQNFNERAVSMLLPFAKGADLENLAAFYGVTRLVGEDDNALLRRLLLAPDSFSVAGPASAYIFHALSADGSIADAAATSPAPGEVLVSLLSATGDGTASPAQIAAVEAVVNAGEVRPLTDMVTVASATIVPFSVAATLTLAAGPDPAIILVAANNRLSAYLASRRRIGRLISATGIAGALQVEGVETVALASPADDLTLAPHEVGHCTAITIEVAA